MAKIDVKKEMKTLYDAPKERFARIDVPMLRYVMVDGQGDPNTAPAYQNAIRWLYPVSYGMKFAAKLELGKDYVVPPLEGLWWADDPADFVARGPTLAHRQDELMPAEKLDFNGRHHEIYLSDPRKTPPGKLKTILRQPVKPAESR